MTTIVSVKPNMDSRRQQALCQEHTIWNVSNGVHPSAASTSSSADEDRGDEVALAVVVYGVNNWMWVDTISSSSICKITAKQQHTWRPVNHRLLVGRRVTLSGQSTANITDGRRSCSENNQCHKQKWKHQRANGADTLTDRQADIQSDTYATSAASFQL